MFRDENVPSDIRASIVMPRVSNFQLVGSSHPVIKSMAVNEEYEKRAKESVDFVAEQLAIQQRDKQSLVVEMEELIEQKEMVTHNGQRVMQLHESLRGTNRQENQERFLAFMQQEDQSFVSFDIETVGDSQDRVRPYGITEVSMNRYDANGVMQPGGYNYLIKQNEQTIHAFQEVLTALEQDPYHFNTLPGWQQRSMVDLMRYSTYIEPSDTHAFSLEAQPSVNGVNTATIKHHSIIDSVFDTTDNLHHAKVVQEMKMYLPYMKSGLETLASQGHAPQEAMEQVAKVITANLDVVSYSYNGDSFDVPVLNAFAKKHGIDLPKMNHIDLLNLIHGTYMDSDDLKRAINPDYQGSAYGKDKQAAYIKDVLKVEDEFFHNSQVDTNNLGKLVVASKQPIKEAIENNKVIPEPTFTLRPNRAAWSDQELTHGRMFYSNAGINAFQEGDRSFRMKWDEAANDFVLTSSGVNNTIIEPRSFYQFAGIQDFTKPNGPEALAFRFYNPETKEYSFVVREGEKAFDQLRDITQSHFYDWDAVDPHMRRQVRHELETDRARRRYDRYFSLEGAGKGFTIGEQGELIERGTTGLSGYKRMLENVAIFDEYQRNKGQSFRDRVANEMNNGLTRNQAKKKVRSIMQDELERMLNFNSQWDPEVGAYVINESEKKAFFKMYPRLSAEAPVYQEAINQIDEAFRSEIELAMKIKNKKERTKQLQLIGQKRDRAFLAFHHGAVNEVGSPMVKKDLLPFEANRVKYMDYSTGNEGSINFEKTKTAQKDIYQFAKRGVAEDHPNRAKILKERTNYLLTMLHSQGHIQKADLQAYQEILSNHTSVYNATEELALLLRENPKLKFEKNRDIVDLTQNPNIQNLNSYKRQQLIERSIQQAQHLELVIQSHKVAGKRLQLEGPLQELVEELDAPHLSRLVPNNYQALEELLASVHHASPSSHVSLTMDPTNPANMRIYVYNGKDSALIQNQLEKHVVPTQALAIDFPMISKSGTHQVGGMVVNAHQKAMYVNKDKIELISSSQQIAKSYAEKMKDLTYLLRQGKFEEATKKARRTLTDEITALSGIQRNMEVGANDTMKWSNNMSDFNKQGYADLDTAMVHDFYYNGYNGIQLTEKDFFQPDEAFEEVNGVRQLKKNVSLEDVQLEKKYDIMLRMTQWGKEKMGKDDPNINFYTSGVKADNVTKGYASLVDMRDFVPYGENYNHQRDNLIQFMNAYTINEETRAHLAEMEKARPGTIYQQPLLRTPMHQRYDQKRVAQGLPVNNQSFQARTAYITQAQFREAIYEMETSVEGRRMLNEVGLMKENGEVDYIKLPRLYEQQGMIDKDFYDKLVVDNGKRFEKGAHFEWNKELANRDIISPGELIGTRTHVSGEKEQVYYQGKSPGTIVAGRNEADDILIQWKDKPFKFMLDGEKMTDTPIVRQLLQYITGSDDIVMAFNPDVEKHKDFGMIMSGQARLLAEHVNQLPVGTLEESPVIPPDVKKKERQKINKNHAALLEQGQARQLVIQKIEQAGLGLTWDEDMRGFIQNSRGMDISKHAFDNLFEELGVSNKTGNGKYSMGLMEIKMSNVENYSKTLDETGRQVIGWKDTPEGPKKVYGSDKSIYWGHREMGVLRSLGMEKTYEFTYGLIQQQSANAHGISRLQESENIAQSLKYLVQPPANAVGISADRHLEAFPEEFKNTYTYKGTAFDQMHLNELSQLNPNAFTAHGYWLELPTVPGIDGKTQKINVAIDRDAKTLNPMYKELDRIFIPFTNVEGANGDVHLRELQKNIKRIVDKAAAIPKAESAEAARKIHESLEKEVGKYVDQQIYEVSSSKGALIGEAFKANMASTLVTPEKSITTRSASGLFKLMDLETSLHYGEGQFTVISEQMAKDLGLYDRLKNGERIMHADIRFPVFHDTALQTTELRMDASVKYGEIHTTSYMAHLLNADSDGDNGFLTIIDDQEIQDEFRAHHDKVNAKEQALFKDRYEKHLAKERKVPTPVDLKDTSESETIYTNRSNSDAEMSAKIGKSTIGQASNLNQFMRQVADQFLVEPDDTQLNYYVKRLGEGFEQKLIDSKHGAKAVGLKMISEIYKGNWQEVIRLDEVHYGGMFAEDYYLKEVAEEMPMLIQRTKNGLRTEGMRFGTSRGVNSNVGAKTVVDLLFGTADSSTYGGNNVPLELFHRHIGVERPEQVNLFDKHRNKEMPLPKSELPPPERDQSLKAKSKRVLSDLMGGSIEAPMERVQTSLDALKNMSGKNKIIAGGALALAGLAGYNILNSDAPERPMRYQPTEKETVARSSMNAPTPPPSMSAGMALPSEESMPPPTRQAPAPRMNTGIQQSQTSSQASIQIEASGLSLPKSQLAQSIQQGMQQSGMDNRSASISIHQTDNTNQLTRQWYQEKVRENI